MLKFSLDPLEFRNFGIYGIAGIWTRAVLNTFLLCKNKNAVLNLIYSLVGKHARQCGMYVSNEDYHLPPLVSIRQGFTMYCPNFS